MYRVTIFSEIVNLLLLATMDNMESAKFNYSNIYLYKYL